MNELHRRLLRSAGPGRSLVAADVLLGILAVGLLIAQATILAHVIAGVFLDGLDLAAIAPDLLILAGLALARGIVAAGFESAGRWGAVAVMEELRSRIVAKVLRERPGGLSGEQRGELATATVQGVDALESFFAGYLPQLVIAVLAPVAILAWSFPRDPGATIILAVTVPMIPVFMVLVGKAAKHRAQTKWRTLARLSGHFLDVVSGLKTLRANSRAEAQVETIRASGERYRDETIRMLRVGFLSALVLELLAMIGVALVAATVGIQLAGGHLDLAAGLTILILAPEVYAPLRKLGAQFHSSTDGMAAAERIFEILDSPATITAPAAPLPCPDPAFAAVELRGVSFSHPGRPEPVLASADLTIAPGETVALVGPSGAGKTTLSHLLMRLADPSAGTLRCGGTDLAAVDAGEWRRRISWVPQRPTIFPGSVADNVRLYDAGASKERVREALERANATGLLAGLPDGLETILGDGSRTLSMGEAQRIALARAFLRPSSLVILDEPAAHLDEESELAIATAAERLLEGRSGLVIAHRPRFAEIADRVVELRAGVLSEPAGVPATPERQAVPA